MPVLINFKICDNAKECSGIDVCPTGAFHWDSEKKTIAVDAEKCTGCGKCAESCPVGAILFAKDDNELRQLQKEIDEDPRTISELFVDRYGAQPIDEGTLTSDLKIGEIVTESSRPLVVEAFSNESIECLIKSIPIKELLKGMDVNYRKMEVKDGALTGSLGVNKLPALLFFNKGRFVGKVEGYYDESQKKELACLIGKIKI